MSGIILLSLVIDAVVGDPRWVYRYVAHPVVWIGRMIEYCDRWWNRETFTVQTRYGLGCMMVLGIVTIVFFCAYFFEYVIGYIFGYGIIYVVIVGVVMSIFMAQRSLYEHVLGVVGELECGDMVGARRRLGMIVGRNTEDLDREGIVRATIESCTENFCDGVVGPVFWCFLGGLPGLVVYKAVSTCDSMVGYRNVRYRGFGWASARLDDVLNWIPARISAILLFLSMYRTDRDYSWRDIVRDASRHVSPNAGWSEATAAYVLGLALGGPRYYGTECVVLSWMNGRGEKKAKPRDIYRTLRMMIRSIGIIWLLLFCIFVLEYV